MKFCEPNFMPFSKLYFFTIVLFLSGFSTLFAFDRKDLIKTAEKIAESHQLLSKETAEWNSEKETLLLELSLIKASIKDFTGNQEKLLSKVEELKKKKIELEQIVLEQEKLLKNINNFATKNSSFLVASCKKIPDSLQFIISAPLKHLQSTMKDESIDIHQKVNAVSSLTSAILTAQKEVHRTKEVLNLNSNLQEIEAIYLGTFTGYFRSSDNKQVGKILFQNGQWSAIEDNSLLETINSLFDQFDKKGTPQIIRLPIGGDSK